MKNLLALALALITSAALADARIEVGPNGYDNKGENTAHFPYDSNDTDNEFYSSAGLTITSVQSDGGNTQGARAENTMFMSGAMLVGVIAANTAIIVTNDTTDEQCTIEANGTTYKSDNWRTTITRGYGFNSEVTMVTECFDGVAQ